MKSTTPIVLMVFLLAGPVSVQAQEQPAAAVEPAASAQPVEAVDVATPAPAAEPDTQAATENEAPTAKPMGRHCKNKSGSMGGGGKHEGKMGCGGKKGGGCKAKHQQIVDRLDLIEARQAKIEAMLEALLRRQ